MFDGLIEFDAVARRLSFRQAARDLAIDASVLSRRIRRLEARLGVLLFQRTTRHVTLTEAGARYAERTQDLLARAADAEAAVSMLAGEPAGRLSVALPNLFGQKEIAPLLPAFLARHDRLKLSLTFTDSFVDLIAGNVDCAVRIGALEAGGGLVVRRLTANRRLLCAAPDYLARRGAPATLEALADHRCLHFKPLLSRGAWRLARGDRVREIAIDPVIEADNAEALRLAAVAGEGIALLATFVIGDDLRAGRLLPVLGDWRPVPSDVSIVYPEGRFLSRKVRLFIDFLVDAFAGEPRWDRGLTLATE